MHEIEAILNAGEVIQTDGMRLFRTRVNGTDEQSGSLAALDRPSELTGVAGQTHGTGGREPK